MNLIKNIIGEYFTGQTQVVLEFAIYCAIFLFIVYLLNYLTKSFITFILNKTNRYKKINVIKYAVENNLPKYLAYILPYIFLVIFVPIIFEDFPRFVLVMKKILGIGVILLIIWIIMAVVRTAFNLLQERPAFQNKPMQSYIQVISIIFYSIGAIIAFAILTNQSVGAIVAGLGAASAVMMLVFQDSIKGFVSSIQLTANNMVKLGDWITVSKYGADGEVQEINLTTVKIRNFDNTVSTLPTSSLISDSFQNWQAMSDSGGRRIKRALYIKQGSIKRVALDKLTSYKSNIYLKEYLDKQFANSKEEDVYITNSDLFMAYALKYLQLNKEIKDDMTCMVRQLAPTPNGLPIEVYAFTRPEWLEHERISSYVINHLISIVNEFELEMLEPMSDTYSNNSK